jgi:hypothetical protein
VPSPATDDDIRNGRVLAILVHKLSYAERDHRPILILRRGFSFMNLETDMVGPPTPEECDAQTAADAETLREFLLRKFQQGIKLTTNQLETAYAKDLDITRERVRKAVIEANRIGAIVERELPKEERQGKRKSYLHPSAEAPM